MFFLLIALGGALGALCRFGVYALCQYFSFVQFPFNTLIVNATGAFIIGFFMSFAIERLVFFDFWHAFIVIGFLGAYTTFSSFSFETIILFNDGKLFVAAANILANNVLALSLTWFGLRFGELIGKM